MINILRLLLKSDINNHYIITIILLITTLYYAKNTTSNFKRLKHIYSEKFDYTFRNHYENYKKNTSYSLHNTDHGWIPFQEMKITGKNKTAEKRIRKAQQLLLSWKKLKLV